MKDLPPIRISKRYNTIQEWIEDYEEVEPDIAIFHICLACIRGRQLIRLTKNYLKPPVGLLNVGVIITRTKEIGMVLIQDGAVPG